MKALIRTLPVILLLPVYLLVALLAARRNLLVWGSTPLISNKYWSEAMKVSGRESVTIMEGFYSINKSSDFDWYFADFAPRWLPGAVRNILGAAFAFLFVLRRARVLHITFDGFALHRTLFWRLEAPLLKLAGVRIVVMPYGADAYVYSRIVDTSLRYGLLASYPQLARIERKTVKRVDYWNRNGDVVIAGLMIDGLGRWDVTMNQIFSIDTDEWRAKADHKGNDGRNGPVRVLHSPNHRGFKGTEFLIDAVERLRAEGLQIELVLLEKVPNDQVRDEMVQADILAEQFIAIGYALSGIEGMASGLPVLANLDHEAYTRVFRRYGFLDECPILSTPPERLVEHLRALVTSPRLRSELGSAGRAYVEKYHSYRTADYLFGAIYRSFDGQDVNLMTLFHPLKSDYNRATPRIEHPLVENRLPADWRG